LRIRESGEPADVMATPPRFPGHHAGYVASGPFTGRQVLVLLGCVVAGIGLLWLPVLGDRLTALVGAKAPRVAPRLFLLGFGLLITGLVAGVRELDVVGGCLIGILVLGVILQTY
jgi:hypothetical protein